MPQYGRRPHAKSTNVVIPWVRVRFLHSPLPHKPGIDRLARGFVPFSRSGRVEKGGGLRALWEQFGSTLGAIWEQFGIGRSRSTPAQAIALTKPLQCKVQGRVQCRAGQLHDRVALHLTLALTLTLALALTLTLALALALALATPSCLSRSLDQR